MSDSYRWPWPKIPYAKQLALVKSNHPLVHAMAADGSNHPPLAIQLSRAIRAHASPGDALGFEFFCLLPAHSEAADGVVSSNPLLIVRIRRGTPLAQDWQLATAAAEACHSVLVSSSLDDIHCLVVEGANAPYCGTASDDTTGAAPARPGSPAADTRTEDPPPVKFAVDVDMYAQACLDRRLLLSLNDQPGHGIATIANPGRAGTMGLVVLLKVTTPDAHAGIVKLLTTCRHVMGDDGSLPNSVRIDRLHEVLGQGGWSSGSAGEQPWFDFIQLGEAQFKRTLDSAQTMLDANAGEIADLNKMEAFLSSFQACQKASLEGYSSTLAKFIAHLKRLENPQKRRVGTAVLSPPLTGPGGGDDWALILSSTDLNARRGDDGDGFVLGPGEPDAGSTPKLNLFWISDFDLKTRVDLRQSFSDQMCNVAGTASWPNDFISLDTYFTQDTIRERCSTAWGTTQKEMLRYDKEDLANHLGSPDAMTVYHVGATSGARKGKLSHVMAYQLTGHKSEDMTREFCILGHQGKESFSKGGDSGSAIFGVLPPLRGAGTDGNKDERRRIGVVGLLRGGEDTCAAAFVSDVTYAIPIDRIMSQVGQQGTILNWQAI